MNEPEIIENPDIIIPRLDTISWDDLSIPEDETYNRVLQYLDDLPSEPEETVDVDEVPPELRPVPLGELTTITAANSPSALQVGTILYTDLLPDFPATSVAGTAYIISISDLATKKVDEFGGNVVKIAYSYRAVGTPNKRTTSSFLNDIPASRTNYNCTGVHYCEYLHDDIKQMSHTEVTSEILSRIQDIRVLNGGGGREAEANSFYIAEYQKFTRRTACNEHQTNTCKPILVGEPVGTITGVPRYYIQCVNRSPQTRQHYSNPIPYRFRYCIRFLQERFNNDRYNPQNTFCHVVEYTGSRRKTCGIDHIQGQGKMLRHVCDVKFVRLVPFDLQRYPYIIWVSIGEHSHPPAALNKTPPHIWEALLGLIRQINDPSLTRNLLMKHPQMRAFCQSYGGLSLQDVHTSLTNEDKVNAMIYKQRLLNYPLGQDIAAVKLQYEMNKGSDKQYIQDFFYDGENLIVICFLKQQLEVFMQQESFQCDMAFKRLKNSDEKEIVFAMLNKSNEKTFTLLRVFVNKETTDMYYRMFLMVFTLIEDKFGYHVRWQHLHSEGFAAMVMDMDTKQLPGFGLYLKHIDPYSRDWQWQIQQTILYCTIHFTRGVERVVKQSYGDIDKAIHSPYAALMQLLYCQTAEDYNTLCDNLSDPSLYPPPINAWAEHKKRLIFRCGLNQPSSGIRAEVWERITANTNAVEQTHYKSNSLGRYATLLRAIDYGALLDKRDSDQLNLYLTNGSQHSWRSQGLSAQLARSRHEYARRQQIMDRYNTEPLEVSQNATSSGNIRRITARGRSQSRARSSQSASSRRSSPAHSLLRQSSQNVLRAQGQAATEQREPSPLGIGPELKHRRDEAETLLKEETAKRLKIENEALILKVEQQKLDIEERKLAIRERQRNLG